LTISDSSSRKFAPVRIFLCVAIVALGGWLAYKQVFTGVLPYDDEGGLLLTLLNYLKHGGLYTSTFTQYGPFYFYAQQTMHAILRLPVSHDGARSITLIYWLSSSLLSLYFIFRLTRSLPLASVCFFLTLTTSRVLCFEPGHPQEIILFLVEGALVLSLFARGRWSGRAFVAIGMISAFLCLTKINVGVFFTVAVLMSSIAVLSPRGSRKVMLVAASLVTIVMPVALIHTHLNGGFLNYCLMATACIAALSLTIRRVAVKNPLAAKQFVLFLGGGFGGTVVVVLISMIQGTSFRSLLNGIIFLPLRHPAVFSRIFWIPRDQLFLVGLLLISTAYLWIFIDKLGVERSLLGAIKMSIGVAALVTLWLNFALSIVVILPLLSILYLEPLGEKRPVEWLFPRLLLCFVVGIGFLQAYPVAGSQLAIALTPGVAWACLLLFDGMVLVREGYPRLEVSAFHVASVSLGLLIMLLVLMGYSDFNIRNIGPALDLPGARRVHVSEQDAVTYRTLATKIDETCDMLFTMPGMGSLNLWSERPTPNGYNLTAWMTAFTSEEQQEIVAILRQTKRSCVVYNPQLLDFWMPLGVTQLSSSPLAGYVFHETRPVSFVSGYQVRVPGKPITPEQ
jgi:hypothetical protein